VSLREGEWSGWLIESRAEGETQYLASIDIHDANVDWTEDPHEALAFAREVDALRIAEQLHGPDPVFVEEHLWLNGPEPEAEEAE